MQGSCRAVLDTEKAGFDKLWDKFNKVRALSDMFHTFDEIHCAIPFTRCFRQTSRCPLQTNPQRSRVSENDGGEEVLAGDGEKAIPHNVYKPPNPKFEITTLQQGQ
jgi:poly(A) polymerase Pap1